ncbi:MAG: DUF3634 family protein [Myxococcaceae bacterium]|nr:DUF3634 family protein [Myxococcaceae bacterium]
MHVTVIVLLVVGVSAFFWLQRARRQFRLVVREGEVTVTHGWLPGPMLADYRSVLRNVPRAVVEGLREEGGVRIGGDVDDFTLQRLRNIAALYPVSAFRASRRPEQAVAGLTATALATAALASSGRKQGN